MRGPQKTIQATRKLMEAPQRLLQEEDINDILPDLCKKCQAHCEGFVHLTCGRGAQHVNTDIEINEMINEVNKTDILNLLIVEKGSIQSFKMQHQILIKLTFSRVFCFMVNIFALREITIEYG